MLLLFFFRFLPCYIAFSYVPDLHTCRILIFISWTVILKFLKMVCIKFFFWCFFMLTVHVEPTEESFSLDLMLRTVNINYFQGLEKYYANFKISARIIVKTLNNLKCLFRKVNGDLPYFQ